MPTWILDVGAVLRDGVAGLVGGEDAAHSEAAMSIKKSTLAGGIRFGVRLLKVSPSTPIF